MNETLNNLIRKLRLSGLAETLEVRLHEASGNSLTHAEFLEFHHPMTKKRMHFQTDVEF